MERLPPVAPRQAPLVALIGAVALAVATVAGGWLASEVRGSLERSEVEAEAIPLGGAPARVAVGGDTVWALEVRGRRLQEISAAEGEPAGPSRRVGAAGDVAADVAATGGAAWVALRRDGAGLVVRVPREGDRRSVTRLPGVAPSRVLVGPDALWALGEGRVASVPRPDVAGGPSWVRAVPLATEMAWGYGSLWVLGGNPGRGVGASVLLRIDAGSGEIVGRRHVPGPGTGVSAGAGAVWVANGCVRGWLRAPVGPGPARCHGPARGLTGIAAGSGRVWGLDGDGSSIVRISPEGAETGRVRLAWRPHALAARGDAAWAVSRRGVAYRVAGVAGDEDEAVLGGLARARSAGLLAGEPAAPDEEAGGRRESPASRGPG